MGQPTTTPGEWEDTMPSIGSALGHQKGKEKTSGLTHPKIEGSLQASALPSGLLAVPSPTKRAPRTP